MARKRVLIFSLQYYPLVGGAEVAIQEITDRIAPEEIAFDMVTLRFDSNSPKEERIGNVQVYRVGPGKKGLTLGASFGGGFYVHKILFVPLAALKAIALHRKHRYDGAWAMMTNMAFPLGIMRLLGVRIPYLLTLQDGDPFERVFKRLRIRIFSSVLFYGIRHASAVQAISNFLANWARQCDYRGPIEVVPNAVSTQRFAQVDPSDIENVKKELGKKESDVYLVTISRLVPKNAVDTVIRALPHLSANVVFLIGGIGPEEEKQRALARALQVEDRVRFLGHVDQKDLPALLHACDIFTRPSRSEGLGISFIEAMAAGIPVIATQVGGISDFLFDAKRNPDKPTTGWAVDVDAPEQIAASVKDILADPERAARITKTAQEMVIKEYDWDLSANRMKAIFEALFSGSDSPR